MLMPSVARNFQLKLHMRQSDRPRVIFEGFKRDVSSRDLHGLRF
jgi:hypothetical protein